jgi:hypothetical protein
MGTFLTRYLNGAHQPVWNELVSLGKSVREQPILADAQAVANETMHRVNQNIA